MATTIKLKNGSGAPLAGDLVQGEPALDLTNKRLYTEDSGGSVIEVGTNPSTLTVTGDLAVDTNTLFVDASTNRVGIGTVSPAGRIAVDVTGNNLAARFARDQGGNGILDIDFSGADANFRSQNQFAFSTGGVGIGGGTERMRIDANGNVGIGTASPDSDANVHIEDSSASLLRLTAAGDSRNADIKYAGGVLALGGQTVSTSNTELDAYTNGSLRMRIDSGGNLLVGTSTLLDTSGGTNIQVEDAAVPRVMLACTGTGGRTYGMYSSTAGTLGFYDYDASVARMVINSSGNVGIGTNSPNAQLEISSAAGATLRLSDTTTNSSAGDDIGTLEFYSADISAPGASVRAYVKAVTQDVYNRSALTFATGDNGGAATERMRIDASGNVGIGTSSPAAPLAVENTASAAQATALILRNASTLTGAETSIDFETSTGGSGLEASMAGRISGLRLGSGTTGALTFSTTSSGVLSERMRIDSSGRLLIGSASNLNYTNTSSSLQLTSDSSAQDPRFLLRGNAIGDISAIDFGAGSQRDAVIQGEDKTLQFLTNSSSGFSGVTERMRIDGSGNLLVGTTSGSVDGSAKLVVGKGSGESRIYINNGTSFALGLGNQSNTGGYIGAGSTTAVGLNVYSPVAASWAFVNSNSGWQAASDERLKDNIKDISYGLDACLSLRPVSFDWKNDGSSSIGFIAQEVQKILPEVVSTFEQDGDEYLGMAKDQITAVLVKSIQEQQAMIEELKAEVAALKGA